ncbi:hypothetical protein [Amycolatopsis sp. NPDC021455]|uniref:hypothetical protein n=1 Tax=Amycolatopsis sp. NPDC021455 TaxID=3154901 RepID=UPI0033FD290C
MKSFHLVRHEDVTGLSGTGVVAEGVQWSNGQVTLCWFGEHSSVAVWPSLEDAMAIHGHNGATEARFLE